MLIPVAVAVLSVALGAALGLVGRGRGAPALSTFALVSALGVVLAQLLPDALAGVGLGALAVFAAAAVAPTLLEKLAARLHRGGAGEALGLELGFLALLVHKIGDGVGLGTYGGDHHADHNHFDVLLAIAAHTVPMVALVTLTFRRASGPRAAIVRASLLAIACVAGVGLPALVPVATFEAIEPWLTAAVGGLLLHVVAHDWQPRQRLVGVTGRLVDLLAVLLGVGVVMLSGHDHHGGAGVRTQMIDALYDLALDTAPALLLGLALGALLTTLGSRLPVRWLRKGGSLRQAFRGAIVGAPLPICACGVLPLASSLRRRGAGPALVVAFLLATPELGIETFALTARFVGWPFAVVRLVAAVVVAMVAALVVARFAPAAEGDFDGRVVPDVEAVTGSFGRRFVGAFDELLYHVAPWTVVGLIAAAYVQAVLPAESLEGMHAYGLDLLVVTLVAVPSYVCAASATPLAAVLLMKGMSPGAVLVGLLLGPATNVATVGFMRASYGTRATVIGGVTLIAAAWTLGLALDLAPIPLATVTPESVAHDHGPVALVAAAALTLVLLRSIWLNGLRAWLGSLGEAMGLGDHGHDHAHGHFHHHAGHDHAGHDHAGHDHAGHDHGGHAGHDHADHARHGHAGHDHGGPDHADHGHAGHGHADHDHAGPDQALDAEDARAAHGHD